MHPNLRLRIHRSTHSTDRPHACDWPECGKRFKDKTTLRRHVFTHSGPKFTCDRKGCQFKTSLKHTQRRLKAMQRMIHKVKEFSQNRKPEFVLISGVGLVVTGAFLAVVFPMLLGVGKNYRFLC
ncbi:unnamed protein product [Oppiella nova]|uniref:C2H2-type domain-containing protein n=1 Tax=Oppiella nova TaxID=334625 RepID=A0A7R9QIE8_9ACAR|nr:unnamed protein product [Oppiella nova]CAG2166475.1 unnamed protein product [Oppiella nova]